MSSATVLYVIKHYLEHQSAEAGDMGLCGRLVRLFLRAAAHEMGGGLIMIIWLVIGFFVCQRLIEMLVAKRNEKKVKAIGAIEFGASHYPYMVAMHAGFCLTYG